MGRRALLEKKDDHHLVPHFLSHWGDWFQCLVQKSLKSDSTKIFCSQKSILSFYLFQTNDTSWSKSPCLAGFAHWWKHPLFFGIIITTWSLWTTNWWNLRDLALANEDSRFAAEADVLSPKRFAFCTSSSLMLFLLLLRNFSSAPNPGFGIWDFDWSLAIRVKVGTFFGTKIWNFHRWCVMF